MKQHEAFEFLRNLPYDRKPCSIDDVHSYVIFNHYSVAIQAMIKRLPQVDIKRFIVKEVNKDVDWFTDAFEMYNKVDAAGRYIYGPQFWLTNQNNEWFLINNEGYNYARYVVKLLGFVNVDTTQHCVPV